MMSSNPIYEVLISNSHVIVILNVQDSNATLHIHHVSIFENIRQVIRY